MLRFRVSINQGLINLLYSGLTSFEAKQNLKLLGFQGK